MKKIIYLLTTIILMPFFSCAQGNPNEMVIGKIENNSLIMTANESGIKVIFERTLNRNGNSSKITRIEMKKDVIEGTETIYYYLIGNNKGNTTKIAVVLILNEDILSARLMTVQSFVEFAETCTCSGSCTWGCDPRRWIDGDNVISWLCTSCQQAGKTCNKSVTSGG